MGYADNFAGGMAKGFRDTEELRLRKRSAAIAEDANSRAWSDLELRQEAGRRAEEEQTWQRKDQEEADTIKGQMAAVMRAGGDPLEVANKTMDIWMSSGKVNPAQYLTLKEGMRRLEREGVEDTLSAIDRGDPNWGEVFDGKGSKKIRDMVGNRNVGMRESTFPVAGTQQKTNELYDKDTGETIINAGEQLYRMQSTKNRFDQIVKEEQLKAARENRAAINTDRVERAEDRKDARQQRSEGLDIQARGQFETTLNHRYSSQFKAIEKEREALRDPKAMKSEDEITAGEAAIARRESAMNKRIAELGEFNSLNPRLTIGDAETVIDKFKKREIRARKDPESERLFVEYGGRRVWLPPSLYGNSKAVGR